MEWLDSFNPDFLAHFKARYPASDRLADAMTYALTSPGKRLRPRFVEESAALIELPPVATTLLAYAVELVHLFSLIHDDLPCLDNDDFRRGLPTVHKKFDEATALLAGDALLSFALETFSEISPYVEPAHFTTAFRFFSRAIGPAGMIGGQSKELEISGEPSLEELLKIQDLKTGALFRAAILTPFLLMGTPLEEPHFEAALHYANAFGFAFQIADDLEDEVQDQANSKKNILSLMGRETAIEQALARLEESPLADHYSATAKLTKLLSKT